jgi:hypothetical protein
LPVGVTVDRAYLARCSKRHLMPDSQRPESCPALVLQRPNGGGDFSRGHGQLRRRDPSGV